jgi:ABC-type arginine/histidine transport system permease subunit
LISLWVEIEGTMNRFRIALAFVFMLAATAFLVTYVALLLGFGPHPDDQPQLVLWDVLRADGLYLAAVLALLGLGWAYFGKIFSEGTPEQPQQEQRVH